MRYPIDCLSGVVLALSLPVIANAGHDRWGRTDASVAEPGAYLVALILTPLFIAFFLWFLHAASEQPSNVSRSSRARTRYMFAAIQRAVTVLLNLF